MFTKLVATGTSVLTALLVVGVAWAATGDDTSPTVTSADSSSTTSAETETSVTSDTSGSSTPTTSDDTTSTSTRGSTSTSLDDDDGSSSTSTSTPSSTSTSSGSSTSTSLDDSELAPPDGVSTYAISGVGTVTIEVRGGSLHLLAVSAPGWQHEIDKAETDRVEIEFESGEAEAEFEARIHHGGIEVRSKVDSD